MILSLLLRTRLISLRMTMAQDYLCVCHYCLSTNPDGRLVSRSTYLRHQKQTQRPSPVRKFYECRCLGYPNGHRFRSKASYHRHLRNMHRLVSTNPTDLTSEPGDAIDTAPNHITASSGEHVDTGHPMDTGLWSGGGYTSDTSDASDKTSNKDPDEDVDEDIEEGIDDDIILDADEASHRDLVAAYVDDTLTTADGEVDITDPASLYSNLNYSF